MKKNYNNTAQLTDDIESAVFEWAGESSKKTLIFDGQWGSPFGKNNKFRFAGNPEMKTAICVFHFTEWTQNFYKLFKGLLKQGLVAKKFLFGQTCKNTFSLIPGDPDRVFVCEGFATGASLNIVTQNEVLLCGSKTNMPAVCEFAQKKYPKAEIIPYFDNDGPNDTQRHTKAEVLTK